MGHRRVGAGVDDDEWMLKFMVGRFNTRADSTYLTCTEWKELLWGQLQATGTSITVLDAGIEAHYY